MFEYVRTIVYPITTCAFLLRCTCYIHYTEFVVIVINSWLNKLDCGISAIFKSQYVFEA